MKRIYQGRVIKVESFEQGEWKKLDSWQTVLWQHHEFFQDAVNYYTLALAALADGIEGDDDKAIAIKGWVERVKDAWKQAKRKAVTFPGPHERIARRLGIDPQTTGFDECANTILHRCKATQEVRRATILRLLEEANDATDLNQMCVTRLPWLCAGKGKLDATPCDISARQDIERYKVIIKVHEAEEKYFEKLSEIVDPGYFLNRYPPLENQRDSEGAAKLAIEYFETLSKGKQGKKGEHPEWQAFKEKFKVAVEKNVEKYPLRDPGRKPKGSFPYAVIFRYYPRRETWEAFKKATQSDYRSAKRAQKTGTVATISADPFVALRMDDEPAFDYFSNLTMIRDPHAKRRAVWEEFDLAAFVEAIKSPHRYFQDTQKRKKAADELRNQIAAMKGRGGSIASSEEAEPVELSGFEGDKRIDLIRKLVTDTLGYLAEADSPGVSADSRKIEYSIGERTLRGFTNIRLQWRKLAEKGKATEDELLKVLATEQAAHRDDFGSAPLYQQLAKPEFHPIWRDNGTQEWHAEDPLKAWLLYKETQYELADKDRPIRFTPAHATASPRFFIFPKKIQTYKRDTKTANRKKTLPSLLSEHVPATGKNSSMQFTAGVVQRTPQGLLPVPMRFSYSAPRLRRDSLRGNSDEDLFAAPWIQPMMAALGLPEPDTQNFANTRITLMPESLDNIQLVFPVDTNADKLQAHISKGVSWNKQFNWGGKETLSSLRWPHEEKPKTPPTAFWWEMVPSFSCLSIDLGQRDAGAFARLDVSASVSREKARFIGEVDNKKWYATISRMGLLRLPGEDAVVWRAASKLDKDNGFAFREELFGEKGRSATSAETEDTAELLKAFGVEEKDFMPSNWRAMLSFPEQNDKLLAAASRAQSRLARLHRWAWFLGDANKPDVAVHEIIESDIPRLAELAKAGKQQELVNVIREEALSSSLKLPSLLVRLANRILPLRGRSWDWRRHPQKDDCFILEMTGKAILNVRIRGQRGLSLERIEQIIGLRKRFQSLNQSLRREIGRKAPARRDDSIPDCCPDLLDKLDRMKEQRVNQTAHMILAEALGLELAPPPSDKKALKETRDIHGQYLKKRHPISFVIIEDLSRYRASQGRAPRENSRLMKWCHRAIRDKLKQLCEPFGIPLLETPAAYSSRFCSRSGVAGFRAVEVSSGFENIAPWYWLKDKTDKDGNLTEDAVFIRDTISMLADFNSDKPKKPRTLILPIAGGPIFVPISKSAANARLQPAIVQADINAAINLGLRAVADPVEWSIHSRLRTQRKEGKLIAREKRKFGAGAEINIIPKDEVSMKTEKENDRNPNYFADLAHCTAWGRASLENGMNSPPTHLVSGKALWSTVKNKQWDRCMEINRQRIEKWRKQHSQ